VERVKDGSEGVCIWQQLCERWVGMFKGVLYVCMYVYVFFFGGNGVGVLEDEVIRFIWKKVFLLQFYQFMEICV